MPAFNVRLLERCLALGDKDHYRKGGRETDLFAEDRKALLALPEARFDVVTWKRMKADKYGIVTVEGRHRYAAGPEHAGREPVVGLRAFEVRAASMPPGPASRRIRAPTATTPPAASGPSLQIGLPWRQARGLAQQPGPGGASRPAARMARRAGARGPRRGAAHAQRGPNARADGRTRWRRWLRSSRPPEASTAPACAWPRPGTPPGPSPSPTMSPSTRRGYDLAFAGREDNV